MSASEIRREHYKSCRSMSAIIDKTVIDCAPEKVFDTLVFFFRDTENYKLWHKDHIACYWKKGKDFSPDSVLKTEKYIHRSQSGDHNGIIR